MTHFGHLRLDIVEYLLWLLKMQWLKHKQYVDVRNVLDFIIQQLEGPGRLRGYRYNC